MGPVIRVGASIKVHKHLSGLKVYVEALHSGLPAFRPTEPWNIRAARAER